MRIDIPERYIHIVKYLSESAVPRYKQGELVKLLFYHGMMEFMLVNQGRFIKRADEEKNTNPELSKTYLEANRKLASWVAEILAETKSMHKKIKEAV